MTETRRLEFIPASDDTGNAVIALAGDEPERPIWHLVGEGDHAAQNALGAEMVRRWNAATYAHMCRDGHEQIGHNDSEYEMCPLCRALAEQDRLRAALRNLLGAERYGERDGGPADGEETPWLVRWGDVRAARAALGETADGR